MFNLFRVPDINADYSLSPQSKSYVRRSKLDPQFCSNLTEFSDICKISNCNRNQSMVYQVLPHLTPMLGLLILKTGLNMIVHELEKRFLIKIMVVTYMCRI